MPRCMRSSATALRKSVIGVLAVGQKLFRCLWDGLNHAPSRMFASTTDYRPLVSQSRPNARTAPACRNLETTVAAVGRPLSGFGGDFSCASRNRGFACRSFQAAKNCSVFIVRRIEVRGQRQDWRLVWLPGDRRTACGLDVTLKLNCASGPESFYVDECAYAAAAGRSSLVSLQNAILCLGGKPGCCR